MNLGRVARLTVFALFAAVIAGGPALHYAPFLGFHDCSDHSGDLSHAEQSSQTAACGCGHDHESTQPSDTTTQLTGERDHAHNCDGSCQVCQFFSQISLDLADCASVNCDHLICRNESASENVVVVTTISSYFERGPPIA